MDTVNFDGINECYRGAIYWGERANGCVVVVDDYWLSVTVRGVCDVI